MRSEVQVFPGPLNFKPLSFQLVGFAGSIVMICGFGDVAQLGERRLCKPEVAGSIPVVSIENLAQLFYQLLANSNAVINVLFFAKR